VDYAQRFRVPPGTTVKLKDIDPRFKNRHEGHKEAAKDIEHYRQRLRELQELFYLDGRRSLLLCLQALDAGGKDGTISHRMHSPVAAPNMPLGLLSLPTTSGSGTSPWPGSSWSTWKG